MSYFDHFALTKPSKVGKFVDAYKIRNEFNQMLPFLQKNKKIKILEIGPGKGELAKLFIDYGKKELISKTRMVVAQKR